MYSAHLCLPSLSPFQSKHVPVSTFYRQELSNELDRVRVVPKLAFFLPASGPNKLSCEDMCVMCAAVTNVGAGGSPLSRCASRATHGTARSGRHLLFPTATAAVSVYVTCSTYWGP